MTYQEVCEQVKAGAIDFDCCGHQVNRGYQEEFIQNYEYTAANANGAADGKWTLRNGDDMATANAQMRQIYQRELDFVWHEDDTALGYRGEVYCFGCGERLHWVRNGAQLTLRCHWDGDKHTHYPRDYRCPYATPQPFRGKIKITSQLVFANFFLHVEDEPEGEKYTNDWCINHQRGHDNVARFKEQHNVAYGQLGNMSVGVYISPDRNSILLGDPYILDRRIDGLSEAQYAAADQEALARIDNHTLVGRFSCEVWRWEATDRADLGEAFYQRALQRLGEDSVIVLEVPLGVWEFEHCYGVQPREEIYARFTYQA